MDLRSFFGIFPPRLLYRDVSAPVELLPVPEKVTLLWHGRTPSDTTARIEKRVETGEDLARNGRGPFVSTVTGHVEDISLFRGVEAREYLAIGIRTDTRESFDSSITPIRDPYKIKPELLRSAVNRAGFIQLSSIIRDPRVWPSIDAMVISALDLDPLSIVNQQMFRDNIGQVGAAVELLARITETSRNVLAVPDNLADTARALSAGPASVALVPPVYPNGFPEMLAKRFGAGLLIKAYDTGYAGNTVVVSLEHALSMLDCLRRGRPMLEKTVTFSNGQNGELRNFRVRIGTPVSEILKKTSVELRPKGKLILNGGMRGYTCFSDEQPVTATTESIHVQDPSEVFFFQNIQCTNCGRCNRVCPVDLEVNLLGRFSEYGIYDKCRVLGAETCIECGLCAYVCPARRPLVQFISHAKHAIRTEGEKLFTAEKAVSFHTEGPSRHAISLFETAPDKKDFLEE
jgi:electron transport complex protein RnfC